MSRLVINLRNLRENYLALRTKFTGADIGTVVKANGYGLGVAKVADALAKSGCKKFFVATFDEAMELRQTLPVHEIYIFHGINEKQVREAQENNLIPVLNNPYQLSLWPKNKPAAIHVDTGMIRLGFAYDELDQIRDYNIVLLMSHLACAENRINPKNFEQLREFDKACQMYPKITRSLCNSYGIFLGKEFHANLARPGIAIYGGNPYGHGQNPMLPVIRITAPILQVFHNHEAKTIGYGATYRAPAGSVTATVEIGYADGILRSMSNRGKCYVAGTQVPYAGRVSMDLITIDISNLSPDYQKIGQEVEIVGENYTICDMARDSGTIEYEILTSLGRRYERVYVE